MTTMTTTRTAQDTTAPPRTRRRGPSVSDILPALERIDACHDATHWLSERQAISWQLAWDSCERGDWMLWLLGRLAWSPEHGTPAHRRLIGCLVEVQHALAWPWIHDRDEATIAGPARRCLDVVGRYAAGEAVTREDLRAARQLALGASSAARGEWCVAAAVAAYAVAAVADAVAVVAAGAVAAVAAGARSEALRCAAEIVREWYPTAPELEAANA